MFYCKLATHSQPTLSQLAENVSNMTLVQRPRRGKETQERVWRNKIRKGAMPRTSYEEVPRAVQPDPPSHSKREIELKCTNIEYRAKYDFVSPQLSTGTYRIQ